MQNSEEQATPLDVHHPPIALENFEVDCTFTNLQVIPLALNFKIYFVVTHASPKLCTLQRIEIYDLKTKMWSKDNNAAVLDGIDSVCPTILNYINKITLFASSSTTKAGLYSWDPYQKSWLLVDNSDFVFEHLNVKNSACCCYAPENVVLVTVFQSFVYIHLHSTLKKGDTQPWKSAKLSISKRVNDCQIQSCIVASNNVFCTLLTSSHLLIYKVDLSPLQQIASGTCFLKPTNSWLLDKSNIKQCFLSFVNEEVVTIMVKEINNKKHVEVSELKHFNLGSLKPVTTFDSTVEVFAAAVVPDTTYMAITYYDSKVYKLYLLNGKF